MAITQVSQVEVERTNVPGVIALSVVSLAGLALLVALIAAVVSLDDDCQGYLCRNN